MAARELQQPGSISPRSLIPFNPERFDAVMAHLAKTHESQLTQRDMVKLHVMTDVYHVLRFGKPVIGGSLERWGGGPVVKNAYDRARHWGHEWERTKAQPDHFRITGKRKSAFLFEATMEVDPSDFSESELQAMEEAWGTVMGMDYRESGRFFHSNDTFMGRAWTKADFTGKPIRWEDIIDAYADLHPSYALREPIKVLVSF